MAESADPRRSPPLLPARATPAKAALQRAVPPEYLPARMINEFVYCPRLFYYEWVEGVFVHSADTVEGAFRHQRVDVKSDPLPPADADAPVKARSVELASDVHRVIAKIDLVEGDAGTFAPVDYKKGRPREGEDGPEAWPADRVQVGVQALVLRDNGYECQEVVLYYQATKQRVRVAIDAALLDETLAAIAAARAAAGAGTIPPPLVDSPKCPRCSLVGVCLPDETEWMELRRPAPDDALQPWLIEPADPAADEHADGRVRRLVPARDDLRPMYVTGQGLTLGRAGGVLQVKGKDRKVQQEARLNDVSQVNVFGNVTVTAGAVQSLCAGEKPIAYFSSGGWFYGLSQGLGLRNVFLRAEQFRQAAQPVFARAVASRLVATKIRNQRTLLQRNHVEPPRLALGRLRRLADLAERSDAIDSLLGLEGTAARIYFQNFSGMIKVEADRFTTFAFDQRNRRPPRDAVNALLSFAYSLLSKDLTIVAATVGLDPYWGFYHQPRFGRPALALDLMEMFRPLVADSAVLTAINTRMIGPDDFIQVGPAVSLTADGRKALLRAYEQRMDSAVTHPQFGYRVSYRRVLEIQTRLLARFIAGEVEDFPPFETR
jgi:CRISPR-associated protein Cas1